MEHKALFHDISPSSNGRTIVLLSLDANFSSGFKEHLSPLLEALSQRAVLLRITDATTFFRWMPRNNPNAIVVTDAYLFKPPPSKRDSFRSNAAEKIRDTIDELVSYVIDGGKVIFNFNTNDWSDEEMEKASAFWERFDRKWKFINRTYSTVFANPAVIANSQDFKMPCNLKAYYHTATAFLGNVEKDELLYEIAPDGYEADTGNNYNKHVGPITWATHGDGRVGYVGDTGYCYHEMGEESLIAIVTMCGL